MRVLVYECVQAPPMSALPSGGTSRQGLALRGQAGRLCACTHALHHAQHARPPCAFMQDLEQHSNGSWRCCAAGACSSGACASPAHALCSLDMPCALCFSCTCPGHALCPLLLLHMPCAPRSRSTRATPSKCRMDMRVIWAAGTRAHTHQ